MDIDWSKFLVTADRDGELEVEHVEGGCSWGTRPWLHNAADMAELMKLIEEHLPTCPVWTGE